MIDLLAKQNEHLLSIVNLMKTDRLMQLAQTYGISEIDKESGKEESTLLEISESIKTGLKQENQHYNEEHSLITEYRKDDGKDQEKLNKHNDDMAKNHLDVLRKIQIGIEKNNFRDIADKAKGEPVHTTFKEDFGNLKDKFSSMKDKVKGATVGGVLKGAKDTILSAVSPRYADKLDYIKNEKSLDNKKSDKDLEKDYDERSKALQANKENEKELVKRKGSLTEEEFLKGNKDWAPTYLENKAKIGETLKQTDSRYRLDDIKETPVGKEDLPLRNSVKNIAEVATEQADDIQPMMASNISNEDEIEANRATKLYQDTQLEHSTTQNETLTEQLDTQKEILDILKKPVAEGNAPASSGSGIDLSGAGTVANKAGGFLKKAGSIASKAAGVLAAPLAVGVIGAGIARAGAEVYSDSFGEGGFDVVKKLQDDKIIDYNATIAGFNPSEVLDWEKLQKVPPEDIKKLLDSGVEFSPEDTDKIKKIYTQSEITGGKDAGTAKPATPEGTKPATPEGTKPATPEGTKPEQVTPEGTKPEQVTPEGTKPEQVTPEGTKSEQVTPEGTKSEQVTPESQGYQEYTPKPEDSIATPTKPVITGNETEAELDAMNKSLGYTVEDVAKPSKANPLTVVPRTADSIYNQSAETTSSSTPAAAPVINNISAPNNTVNNSSSKSPMKIDVKNPESSVNNMFASRQRFS